MGLTGGMHRKGRGLCKWGRVGVIIHSKSSISIITAPLMRQSFAARCCCRRAAASCAPCATPHARSTPALPWRRGPRLLLCTIFWLDIAMISSHKTMSMGSMRRRPLPTPEAALRARGCASPYADASRGGCTALEAAMRVKVRPAPPPAAKLPAR